MVQLTRGEYRVKDLRQEKYERNFLVPSAICRITTGTGQEEQRNRNLSDSLQCLVRKEDSVTSNKT